MKKLYSLLTILFVCASASAQDVHVPETFALTLGGGLSLPDMDTPENTFFYEHNNIAGYNLKGAATYYITPAVGVGLQYDYSRYKKGLDKMHMNYVGPQVTGRYIFGNGKQAALFSLGCGYLDYSERTYMHPYEAPSNGGKSNKFQKGYFGIAAGAAYEFAILPGVSGQLRMDVITADWFFNRDWHYNNTFYEDDYDNDLFKNNLTVVNIGFALSFGR